MHAQGASHMALLRAALRVMRRRQPSAPSGRDSQPCQLTCAAARRRAHAPACAALPLRRRRNALRPTGCRRLGPRKRSRKRQSPASTLDSGSGQNPEQRQRAPLAHEGECAVGSVNVRPPAAVQAQSTRAPWLLGSSTAPASKQARVSPWTELHESCAAYASIRKLPAALHTIAAEQCCNIQRSLFST